MNYTKIFLLAFLTSFGLNAFGQNDFLQITQVPLLLNPSLVGGKAKNRVAAAFNNYSEISSIGSYKRKNAYGSYDWLMKKYGIGAGIYYNFSQVKSDYFQSNLNQDH